MHTVSFHHCLNYIHLLQHSKCILYLTHIMCVFFVYLLTIYCTLYLRQARTPLPFRHPPPHGTFGTDPECTDVPRQALHDVDHDWSLVSYCCTFL